MSEDLGRFLDRGRRDVELFRKGLVTAVNRAVVPHLATINGRPMPFIDAEIQVGDVVFYVDQPDPFAWARFDGLGEIVPGQFRTVQAGFAGRYRPPSSPPDVDTGWTFPEVGSFSFPSAVELHWASIADSPVALVNGSAAVHATKYLNTSTMSLSFGTHPGPGWELCSLTTSYLAGSDHGADGGMWIAPVYAVRSESITAPMTGAGPFEFPVASVPGVNWLVVHFVHASDTAAVGDGGGSAVTWSSGLTQLWAGSLVLNPSGDFKAQYHWSAAAGAQPQRTVTLDEPRTVRLGTLVLDTRSP